ncbi:hypothetical protein DERP_006897 [Dermatophagoides pteronyssinus]|uniref:Uncharacterized protein n=1 Tax=Dermatophagoides pteronyssinus TaxID=6956 RepID=A0ABQ8ISB4_DERPT|nr:hypothetical protein DERP_006897 [Dermatophagoides pteronyssinus]
MINSSIQAQFWISTSKYGPKQQQQQQKLINFIKNQQMKNEKKEKGRISSIVDDNCHKLIIDDHDVVLTSYI